MKYLGLELQRPKVGVFDFTGCEGCQLQLANREESLVDFLQALELVNFRELASDASSDYDIAFIDGAITRADEEERLNLIRARAVKLVALGSCACFGGVSRLKNALDQDETNRLVYGEMPQHSLPTRAIKEVVDVDLEIPGCPVNKEEVERIVQHLIWDVPYNPPVYPVCVDCKQRFTVCVFQLGQLCLGPITRGGCNAPCPAGGLGCWGCRGPAADPNYGEFFNIAKLHGYDNDEVVERLSFFGGFESVACE